MATAIGYGRHGIVIREVPTYSAAQNDITDKRINGEGRLTR